MPHISKRKINKKTYRKLNRKLIATFEDAHKKQGFTRVFRELFTYTEKIMLTKRLAIILLLDKEIPQHRIVDILHVSPSTVAKMSLNLEKGKYEAILQISKEKKTEFLDFIEFLLTAGGTLRPRAGRGRWKKIFKDF